MKGDTKAWADQQIKKVIDAKRDGTAKLSPIETLQAKARKVLEEPSDD